MHKGSAEVKLFHQLLCYKCSELFPNNQICPAVRHLWAAHSQKNSTSHQRRINYRNFSRNILLIQNRIELTPTQSFYISILFCSIKYFSSHDLTTTNRIFTT